MFAVVENELEQPIGALGQILVLLAWSFVAVFIRFRYRCAVRLRFFSFAAARSTSCEFSDLYSKRIALPLSS